MFKTFHKMKKPNIQRILSFALSGGREGGTLKKCPADNFSERASWRNGKN